MVSYRHRGNINLDSLPVHTQSGAAATKRAKARKKRLQGRPMSPKATQTARAPFAQSGEAFADLTQALGYPPAVIPPLRPNWRHKLITEEQAADEEGEE